MVRAFVESIARFCSDISQVELRVVNDGGNEETWATLTELAAEYPWVHPTNETREERVAFIREKIEFYEKESIFPVEDIEDMRTGIVQWTAALESWLWLWTIGHLLRGD